jgi:hypothetical protein
VKFKSEHQNPLPDLVELMTRIAPKDGDDTAHEILVELRVHPHEIEESFGTIGVEISEAILSLQLSGLEVVPGTKFSNPVIDSKTQQEVHLERKVTDSTDNARTQSGGFAFSSSAIGLVGKIEASRVSSEQTGQSVSDRTSRTDLVEHYHVKAIGNDNWKICGRANGPLDGVYVNNQSLCEVAPVANANRVGAETELVVRQRHLKAEMVSDQSWFASLVSTNQKKIAKILIAKSLHEAASDEAFDGKFVFAKSQSFDEG